MGVKQRESKEIARLGSYPPANVLETVKESSFSTIPTRVIPYVSNDNVCGDTCSSNLCWF